MKALVTRGQNDMSFIECAPPMPASNEVRLRVGACAICAGDISAYKRREAEPYDPPRIPGHELSGTIDMLGKDVTGYALGMRVAVMPTVPCGKCEECITGNFNRCQNRRVIGSVKKDGICMGGMAQYVCIPVQSIVPIPDNLSFVTAALCEPVAVCLHSIKRAGPLKGMNVVIYGAGVIGLILLELIKLEGVKSITVIDKLEARLRMASEAGASYTLLPDDAVLNKIREFNFGRGADVVFDAVGTTETTDRSMRLCRGDGTVVMVGLAEPEIKLNYRYAVDHEINLTGSITYTGEMAESVKLLSNREICIDHIITSIVPLEKGPEIFEDIINNPSKHIKTVFKIE